jgi:hypothetical protein
MDSSLLHQERPLLSENSIDLFYLCQIYAPLDRALSLDERFFTDQDFLSSEGVSLLLEAFGEGLHNTLTRLATKVDLTQHHHCLFMSANIGASLLLFRGLLEGLLSTSSLGNDTSEKFLTTYNTVCPDLIEELSFTIHAHAPLITERTLLGQSVFTRLFKELAENNRRDTHTSHDGLLYALELSHLTFPQILSDIVSNLSLNYSIDKSPRILLKHLTKIVELLAWGRLLSSERALHHIQ